MGPLGSRGAQLGRQDRQDWLARWGSMLARPTLCGGGVDAGSGFRGDFPPSYASCPVVANFLSAPLHRPCDKDRGPPPPPPRKGTASEVDGCGRGGQKSWFRRDDLRYRLWFRAWRRGVADGMVQIPIHIQCIEVSIKNPVY